MEQNKELNLRDDHWENAVEIPESNREDPSNAVLRMMSAWMNNNDEVKRKRGYRKYPFILRPPSPQKKRKKYFTRDT